jgi:hypothetical protein
VQGQLTTLCFNDFRSDPFEVHNGLDQGCPASRPLFQFYNADLIEPQPSCKDKLASAFVDNTYLTAQAPTIDASYAMLNSMMTCPKGALEWSASHFSKFELDKTGLMTFTTKKVPHPTLSAKRIPLPRPLLIINGHSIPSSPTHKFLGIILDQELRFKAQADATTAKGKFWITQTQCIAKTAKGILGWLSCHLYIAAAIPAMLYGTSAWITPINRGGEGRKKARESVGTVAKLRQVQRMAAIHITGGLHSSPLDLLDVHADILPIELLIDKHCHREALRLATLPLSPARHSRQEGRQKETAETSIPSPWHSACLW